MVNLSLIRTLCGEKKITLKELADAVSISQNGMQRIIKENSTKIETLEKIASYLDVPITDFFRNDKEELIQVEEYKNKIRDLEKIIENLTKELNNKKEELNDKKQIINLLSEKNAISVYNLTTTKEEREKERDNLDLYNIDKLIKDINDPTKDILYKKDLLADYLNDLAKKIRDEEKKKAKE